MPANEIQLNAVWQKRYKTARFFLYVIFTLTLFYVAYLILFPSAGFNFFFKTPDSSKNTVVEPRTASGALIRNGATDRSGKMIFDANPLGDYSEAEVSFILENKSADIQNGIVSVRKSYRSFFYPEGKEAETLDNLKAPLLLSSNDSVFLESDGKVWPIADVPTFEAMGFNWNNVTPASSEEIGTYEKQKLFTLKTPHPNGIVFFDKETGKYYLVENGEKREIKNAEAINSYLKINPIIADSKGLEAKSQCELRKSFGFYKTYKCTIPTENIKKNPGNDYQFEVNLDPSVKIQTIDVTFKKPATLKNAKSSLSIMKSRIKANYSGQ
ncbi:MAG: hypothetical protein Q7S18_01720 [bacterium]|nr:hypothetical protein [bacterium]